MFVTNKTLHVHIKNVEYELRVLRDKYWSLSEKHERLLEYFGLVEHVIPRNIELRPNGRTEHSAHAAETYRPNSDRAALWNGK